MPRISRSEVKRPRICLDVAPVVRRLVRLAAAKRDVSVPDFPVARLVSTPVCAASPRNLVRKAGWTSIQPEREPAGGLCAVQAPKERVPKHFTHGGSADRGCCQALLPEQRIRRDGKWNGRPRLLQRVGIHAEVAGPIFDIHTLLLACRFGG